MSLFRKILLLPSFVRLCFVVLMLLPINSTASNEESSFIPIFVGGMVTFVQKTLPIPEFDISPEISSTPSNEGADIEWESAGDGAYYQLSIEDESGSIRIIRIKNLGHTLVNLSLGNNIVRLAPCNVRFVCGDEIDVEVYYINEKVRFVHVDILGTPILETDQEGNVIAEFRYKPFGEK